MRRAVLLLCSIAVTLLCAEATARALDGYAVFSVQLHRVRYTAPTTTPDRQYLRGIALAPGVDADWYEQNPPAIARIPLSSADEARLNANHHDSYAAFRLWNPAFVRLRVCDSPDHGRSAFGDVREFLVFDSPDDQPYPSYRHMPRVSPPGWFVVNSFGWRGPDLTAARPPDTIRIAFVGASTTIDPYAQPFSHIELVGLWLNEWAASRKLPYRFDVINAARTGIDSSSIREIVRQEVLSVDPDLIVYYEGANDFAPGKAMRLPETLPPAPKETFESRGRAEEYSAIAVRLYDLALKLRGRGGYEPKKPGYPFKWVDGVSETSPDISKPKLPMDQQVIVENLKLIQAAAVANGTDFAIASFVWMVYPGMRLDLSQHLVLFRYLNDTYFPATYALMRRMADFQNRVFRAFANAHGATYLPMDETYPRDPDLFGDAIHMTERGQRLQAWIYLQQLIPIIQAHIDAHRWPKTPAATPVSAAWATTPPHTVSLQQVIESCPVRQ